MKKLDELPRVDAICTKCGQSKRPMKGYIALLKSQDLPYVCQSCREAEPPPPLNLGTLGIVQ